MSKLSLARAVSPRLAIAILTASAAASAGLSVAIGQSLAQDSASEPAPEITVEWGYRPTDLPELVEQTPAIILAEVVASRPGDPIEIAPAEGAEPAVSVPSELIDLTVIEQIEGGVPAALTLYQIGGPGLRPDDAPALQPGERHLLFVRPRLADDGTPHPDGTWIAVAPDGRLERVSGELEAAVEGPVAEELAGDTLSEAKSEIAAAEAGSPSASDGE